MSNDPEGRAAIKGLNGKEFGGRTLTVNEARPKEDRPKRPRPGPYASRGVPKAEACAMKRYHRGSVLQRSEIRPNRPAESKKAAPGAIMCYINRVDGSL